MSEDNSEPSDVMVTHSHSSPEGMDARIAELETRLTMIEERVTRIAEHAVAAFARIFGALP